MKRKMILASHGRMAEGIMSSMQMVVGNVDDLQFFGLMPGEEPDKITEVIEAMVKEEADTQFLILVDIRGGSVSNSLTRLTCYEQVKLIQGMNLALAIGLYLTDGALSDEMIECVIADARDGICLGQNLVDAELDESEEIF